MRLKSFLISALAVATFAACSKDGGSDSGEPIVPAGQNATLKLIMDLPTMNNNGRATETTDNINDGATAAGTRIGLANFALYVIDGSGNIINVFTETTLPANMATTGKEYNTTTDARNIYLLGNMGAYTSLPGVGGTLTQLRGVITNLTDITQSGSTALLVAGNSSIGTWTAGVNESDPWTATCDLTPIPVSTKLNITVTNNMLNYTNVDGDGSYKIRDISVLYAAEASHIFAPATRPAGIPYAVAYNAADNPYYASGLATWPGYVADQPTIYSQVNISQLTRNWNVPFSTTVDGSDTRGDMVQKETFYVYPGMVDANTGMPTPKSMIVTVRIASSDTEKEDLFYSIVLDEDNHMDAVNSGEAKYPSNGRLYNIAMTIRSDAGTGGSGQPDPETPTAEGDVTVTIQPIVWTVVDGINGTWD